jgi:hypothetical protein
MKHALYGVKKVAVAQVGQAVSSVLSVELEQRESDYLGIYLSGMAGSTKVRIVGRPDPEGEPFEREFPEWDVLIYLDGPDVFPSLGGLELEGGVIRALRG